MEDKSLEKILQTPIIEEVRQGFLDYSLSVITDRALPSIEDGFKPVVRRILYTMYEDGNKSSGRYRKCAEPVGNTMSRYHPHGDSAIYGALVGVAQPWTMRYPLIDFHGNAGSRDNDSPASYRYTESRLTKLAEATMENVAKCSDMQPNYSETKDEPIYLPGLFPNLLCNGTSGIAVAMACNFAPHNLTDVLDSILYAIDNPDYTIADLVKILKAPDFPTGGLITNQAELITAYETGKGRVRLRGEYKFEKNAIVFTSVPYKVSKEDLVVSIANSIDEGKITGVSNVRDETNKHGVRFVVELEKRADPEKVIKQLFGYSNLEISFSINQVALLNKSPKLMTLRDIVENYVYRQRELLLRRLSADRDALKLKAEILKGLLIALEDIDNIIALIKGSNESAEKIKQAIMKKYGLTYNQSKAIVDMKLIRLSKVESVEVQAQLSNLLAEIDILHEKITNPESTKKELKRILNEFKKEFGDERRTSLTNIEHTTSKETVTIESEDVVVTLTKDKMIKRTSVNTIKHQKKNTKGTKNTEKDIILSFGANTIDTALAFTNNGKMYRIGIDAIPTDKSSHINALLKIPDDEEIVEIVPLYDKTNAEFIVFVTKDGVVKKTLIEEYANTKKNGLIALKLRKGDILKKVTFLKDEDLVLITKLGFALRIKTTEINAILRTTIGVKGIALKENDSILKALPIKHETDFLTIFTENGLGKKISLTELIVQSKGTRGISISKADSVCADALLTDEKDKVIIVGEDTTVCINASEIPVFSGRNAAGNQIFKGKVVCVNKTK